MKRIITPLMVLSMLFATVNKLHSQTCSTGGTFTTSSTYNFASNAQDFSGDFGWVSQAAGELQSTPVSAGQTKVLTTTTFFQPVSNPTIGFSFDLGGTANVTGYTVDALYYNGSSVVPIAVCTGGGSLSTSGGTVSLTLPAPSVIQGTNFRLRITFTSSSTGSKTLLVDNFNSNVGAAAAPLPVTFAYFGVSAVAEATKLTWMVGSEYNVNRYEVERSTDGKTFLKIGSVPATSATGYSYLDVSFETGANYYRLKSVDNDGQYKYSTIVVYKADKSDQTSSLKAYPIPANSELTLFHDAATTSSSINILATDGTLLKTAKSIQGATETQINISSLKPGLYLARYANAAGDVSTIKIIKQ